MLVNSQELLLKRGNVHKIFLSPKTGRLLTGKLMCAIIKSKTTNCLENSTSEEVVAKNILEQFPHLIIEKHFRKFHINTELNELVLSNYIQQFYIHLSQDLRTHSDSHFEVALQLISNKKDRNTIFYYILGFEVLKMIFQMSWLQHERLYELQKNQESFIINYIKPIQNTHRINGIIVPRHENIFFAKRSYFVKQPKIRDKKLTELVMATFTTDTVKTLGFLIVRHLNFLVFDYQYIFGNEPESLFLV
jgi:hypothetical protein